MANSLTHVISLLFAYAWFAATAHAAATMPPQFNANGQTTGWVGEVEFTSFDFGSNNECLIKADFKRADWTGNVFAIPVDKNGNLVLAASCWNNDFGDAVNTQAQDHATQRRIGTLKSDGTRVPFVWPTKDSSGQYITAAIDHDKQAKSLGDDTKGPKILNYIRGDRSNEDPNGEKYRARGATVLGDIVHSRPLYIPHPTAPRVYVGANDGMLHAIEACKIGEECESGNEAWAYIPSFLINGESGSITDTGKTSSLATLASPTSPYPHRYFVDATPNARKIPAASVGSGQSSLVSGGVGKTILVGGVGPGSTAKQSDGKLVNGYSNDPKNNAVTGLFALDITDPTAASDQDAANKIMWEITNGSINNTACTTASTCYLQLGQTYGIPLIVKMNDGNWAVVIGNGYSQADGGTGQAYLYVINLATGAKIAEVLATIGNAADDAHPNGLSSPTAVDTNNDGMVDYVYAGDLGGNLWKFDVRATAPSSWTAFKLFSTPNANTTTAQAITGAPAVALHPRGGFMVMFGTGRAFTNAANCGNCTTDATHLNDLTNTTQQYVYGLWDNDQPASGTALSRAIDSTKLVDQSLSAPTTFGTNNNALSHTVRTVGGSSIVTPNYNPGTGQKQGWRLILARNVADSTPTGQTVQNAERVLGDGGMVAASRYHVTLSNPNFDNGTTGTGSSAIANARGDNWLLEIDYLTGSAPSTPVFDLTVDNVLDDSDLVPGSTSDKRLRIPVARRIAKGGLMSQPVLAALDTNGQTYFNLNPDVAYAASTSTSNPGISNGHFDFDIYYPNCTPSSGGYSCKQHTHIHQYDDKFNVTGVDMQNASSTAYNLVNAVPGVGTKFKILVANQRLSPSVNLMIGNTSATYTPAINIQTSGWPMLNITPTSFVSSLPTYSRGGVTNTTKLDKMYLKMPLYAFSQQDWPAWWNNGSGATCTAAPNTWTTGNSMGAARKDHTATLLGSNGKALIAGGSSGSGALATAELYTPLSNAWSATGSMGTARQYHAAVQLASGKVLVTGGNSGSGAINTTELYDPLLGTWSSAANMVNPRQNHTATLLVDGKVLVTGGTSTSGTVTTSAEIYDPAANTWSSAGNMSSARVYQTATLLNDGRVLVAGGATTASPTASLISTELYTPSTNTWAAGANMAKARRNHAAVLLVGGKVLVSGGIGDTGGSTILNLAEAYTPASGAAGAWASAGTMTSARQYHTATLMATNGKVLVTGGNSGGSTVEATAGIYNPTTNTWAATANMTTARDFQTATQLATGKILVAGGLSTSATTTSAELYDPDTNCRVGLIPSQTGCITSNKGGFVDNIGNATSSVGPYGNLWMNGAMTIQVIKDTTPDSAIRLASTSGDPTFGYRLKSDVPNNSTNACTGSQPASQCYQLAQYTIFWHHPNGRCYGDSTWGTTATIAYPDSASSSGSANKAPGSDDPTDGDFTGPGGSTGGGGEGGGNSTPEGVPYTYTTADGVTYTQYVKTNADGSVTITIVGPDGTVIKTFPPGQGPVEGRKEIKSGRNAWKQLVRP